MVWIKTFYVLKGIFSGSLTTWEESLFEDSWCLLPGNDKLGTHNNRSNNPTAMLWCRSELLAHSLPDNDSFLVLSWLHRSLIARVWWSRSSHILSLRGYEIALRELWYVGLTVQNYRLKAHPHPPTLQNKYKTNIEALCATREDVQIR